MTMYVSNNVNDSCKYKYKNALVIGAGAFGTSIGSVLSNNFERVIFSVYTQDIYDDIKKGRNEAFLPGKILPKNLYPALTWTEINDLLNGEKFDLIVFALPTTVITGFLFEHFDDLIKLIKDRDDLPILSLAKGIDPVTLELPDDLFFNFFPDLVDQFVFLSGPSFASEIMDGQITLVSIAGRSKKMLEKCASMLETHYFKSLPNYDVKGVLLGGALKNILAIAGGIIQGLGFNDNTRAAMITRGIVEMLRFGQVFNARSETFYGLSGMGDLILTTTGEMSRNKRFGLELAKGRSPQEIINESRQVIEGYKTCKAAYALSEKYEIRARIFNGVYAVLYQNQKPQDVIKEMMSAPTKFEF